jgi:hypothetical protein
MLGGDVDIPFPENLRDPVNAEAPDELTSPVSCPGDSPCAVLVLLGRIAGIFRSPFCPLPDSSIPLSARRSISQVLSCEIHTKPTRRVLGALQRPLFPAIAQLAGVVSQENRTVLHP